MPVNLMFAGLPVANLKVALAWYERFMGRTPDLIPNEDEAAWQVTDTGWLYIIADASHAGSGLLTLLVDDLKATVAELNQRGVASGGVDWVVPESVQSMWITDPDGNRIQMGQVLNAET